MLKITGYTTGATVTFQLKLNGVNTGSPLATTEAPAGTYTANPTGLADGDYTADALDGATVLGTLDYYWRDGEEVTSGALHDYIETRSSHPTPDFTATLNAIAGVPGDVWDEATRSLTEAVATDSASRTASKATSAELGLPALSTAINAIPTTPLLAGNYTAPPSLANIQSAVTATETAILDRGNTAWITATGFNTVAPDNTAIELIEDLVKYAAISVLSNVSIDETTAIATYTGVGLLSGFDVQKQLRNAAGAADAVNVFNEILIV